MNAGRQCKPRGAPWSIAPQASRNAAMHPEFVLPFGLAPAQTGKAGLCPSLRRGDCPLSVGLQIAGAIGGAALRASIRKAGQRISLLNVNRL